MSTFEAFSVNELKESSVDTFVKLFKKYEFFDTVTDFKTSATRIFFNVGEIKFKIELSLGEVIVTKDGKKVFSNDFDVVEQSLVDGIVDYLQS